MKLRIMTAADVPAGMRLKDLAGWNQAPADWRRFLENSPRGCFVAEVDGRVVGTTATIVYEGRVAWIGLVLVDPDFRGRGIGTRLLERAIEHLDGLGVPNIKLDATPQGRPIYEKLGFRPEYEIERWVLARRVPELSGAVAQRAACEKVLRLDGEIFGADRSGLLHSLAEDAPEFVLVADADEEITGYAFGRHGMPADHLGPWMARDAEAAQLLLDRFLRVSSVETIIVDALKARAFVADLLRTRGFRVLRPLTRMVRGPNEFPGKPELLCAILGPEFG